MFVHGQVVVRCVCEMKMEISVCSWSCCVARCVCEMKMEISVCSWSCCVARWVCEMKTGIIRYRHLLGSQRVLVADADVVKDIMVTNARYYPRPVFLFGSVLCVLTALLSNTCEHFEGQG